MKVIVSKNHEESSRLAAIEIAKLILKNNKAVLGFATGNSPIEIYKNLIKFNKEGIISFKDVTAFNLDEYVGIEKEDKNSYYYFMEENLFSKIDIKKENCHIENGKATNLEEECKRYEETLAKYGPQDLQILGIGRNGHIGFVEPKDFIKEKTHVADLTNSTMDANSIYFENGETPKKALTMGIGTIMKAKKIILIANTEKKAKAIKNTVKGDITPLVPASLLRLHPDCTIYVDKDAGMYL